MVRTVGCFDLKEENSELLNFQLKIVHNTISVLLCRSLKFVWSRSWDFERTYRLSHGGNFVKNPKQICSNTRITDLRHQSVKCCNGVGANPHVVSLAYLRCRYVRVKHVTLPKKPKSEYSSFDLRWMVSIWSIEAIKVRRKSIHNLYEVVGQITIRN